MLEILNRIFKMEKNAAVDSNNIDTPDGWYNDSNNIDTPDGCYTKELSQLCRNIDKLTCGQAKIDLSCEKDRAFYLFITPNDGYYKDATFKFKVSVPETFPINPPHVTCLNNVYHPNIDILTPEAEASLCVSLLNEDWEVGLGLDWCVLAVLFLFHHPNLEDALSPVFGGIVDEEEFVMNVRASLRGGEVEGVVFDKLINECEETGCMISIGHPATAECEINAGIRIKKLSFEILHRSVFSNIWHKLLNFLFSYIPSND